LLTNSTPILLLGRYQSCFNSRKKAETTGQCPSSGSSKLNSFIMPSELSKIGAQYMCLIRILISAQPCPHLVIETETDPSNNLASAMLKLFTGYWKP
jgi:hypothetical protein